MQDSSISGWSILIVEDEPLIVMDLTVAFEHYTGVEVTSTNTLRHAMLLVEHDGISGAILDHALPDGDSTALRQRLTERGIPFIVYSGYQPRDIPAHGVPHFTKPQNPDILFKAIGDLIKKAKKK